MHLLARSLALLGLLFLALPVPAQEFPSRPITLICPWPPGGGGIIERLGLLAK